MTNKTKAAIEEAAKLPTAEETLSQTYKSAGWRYDLSVLPTGCPHESLALDAIESHTQAHTGGLRDVLREVDEYLSGNPKNYVGSGSILHQKIQEAIK